MADTDGRFTTEDAKAEAAAAASAVPAAEPGPAAEAETETPEPGEVLAARGFPKAKSGG